MSRTAALLSRRAGLLVLVAGVALAQSPGKRPLTLRDFDAWRSIQSQKLSPDGRFLAYALFPQSGDGELVVRSLATGTEYRESIGARPPLPPPDFTAEPTEGPPTPPGIRVEFTADSRHVVFSTLPSKAEADEARKAKKTGDAAPKGGLVVLDLQSGTPTRIARVKRFAVPESGNRWMAYLREPAPPATAAPKPATETPAGSGAKEKKPELGTELVLHRLADRTERTFADVSEFSLAKDATLLVFAVSGIAAERNGVYVVPTATTEAPTAVLAGKGKYSRLTWDEAQTQLAFLSDRDDAAARQPVPKVYLWARPGRQLREIASSATPGLPQGWVVTDRGALSFSRDGQRLFLGTAPAPPPSAATEPKPDEISHFDLWHWRDDYIQPMQKVRARSERTRSYRAVVHLADGALVQLADRTMAEVTPSEDGRYALGADDREYRSMVEYDERFSDTYLLDTRTGSRKLLARKHIGRLTWAPDGRHALLFNGRDWHSVSVPEGTTTNLTGTLDVKFWTEEWDMSGSPAPYGNAGWTKDGKGVLLYDHYDVWLASADGSGARNLTEGIGRKERTMLRVVRLDPEERFVDPAKPLLLRAENVETRATGFYRDRVEGSAPPERLVWADKNLGTPMKARNADVLVLTRQTFTEVPNLHVTDGQFREPRQVTDANPQIRELLWGTAEQVRFRNLDGVALTATLYKPDNFDPAKRYPMIVYIYERLSQNRHSFVDPVPRNSINVSHYVSNGYLVLQPDIVYTVGFPGQSALKCVMPAVQTVVDRGFVDEGAIGIQGHSWGGYQIAYMVTQTNRFKAAAPGAVVANMTSAYNGIRYGPGLPRQFQYERTQSRIGGTLWQMPTRFIENSPVFMADRIRTPLLMMHNDADDAVPWTQGIEMFLALRRLNREAYMVNYNGEPHNLRQRPNQKDYTEKMMQFFDHHLKGAPKPEWMERGRPFLEREGAAGPSDR